MFPPTSIPALGCRSFVASDSSTKVHTSLGSSGVGRIYTVVWVFFLFIEAASSGWYSAWLVVCVCHRCFCCLAPPDKQRNCPNYGLSCISRNELSRGANEGIIVSHTAGCNNCKDEPCFLFNNHSWRVQGSPGDGCGWLDPAAIVEAALQSPLGSFP